MPRKLIRRILPDMAGMLKHRSMRWMVPFVRNANLLHINRESVSLAVFIGIFAAFLPLPGQTFIAAAVAFWWGANLPISVTLIWISNPLTMGPMFYLTYKLGATILGSEHIDFTVALTWQWFSNVGGQILLPLLVGSILAGIFAGTVGYLAINYLWRWKVVSNWQKRKNDRINRLGK